MNGVNRLLLVEDEPKDLKYAAETAHSLGISVVDARTTLQAARDYLERGLAGEGPLPDGIIVDLNLGYDSGYELLRLWHSTPRLLKIPLVVWSVRGEDQREMCNLFKVTKYVSKWDGEAAFREALGWLHEPTTQIGS
jgi:CheY-like chemotaxis protein